MCILLDASQLVQWLAGQQIHLDSNHAVRVFSNSHGSGCWNISSPCHVVHICHCPDDDDSIWFCVHISRGHSHAHSPVVQPLPDRTHILLFGLQLNSYLMIQNALTQSITFDLNFLATTCTVEHMHQITVTQIIPVAPDLSGLTLSVFHYACTMRT